MSRAEVHPTNKLNPYRHDIFAYHQLRRCRENAFLHNFLNCLIRWLGAINWAASVFDYPPIQLPLLILYNILFEARRVVGVINGRRQALLEIEERPIRVTGEPNSVEHHKISLAGPTLPSDRSRWRPCRVMTRRRKASGDIGVPSWYSSRVYVKYYCLAMALEEHIFTSSTSTVSWRRGKSLKISGPFAPLSRFC